MCLRDFNTQVERADVSKSKIRAEIVHKISNVNGVRVINVTTSGNLIVKNQCSHIVTFINALELLLMGKSIMRLIMS
jgi:hypothetical protein